MNFDVNAMVGSVVTFEYPRHNFHGVLSKVEKRRVQVRQIRDLSKSPLERVTVEMQPLLRRGTRLVTGFDLDKKEERSFYLSSMRSVTQSVTTEIQKTATDFAEESKIA